MPAAIKKAEQLILTQEIALIKSLRSFAERLIRTTIQHVKHIKNTNDKLYRTKNKAANRALPPANKV